MLREYYTNIGKGCYIDVAERMHRYSKFCVDITKDYIDVERALHG